MKSSLKRCSLCIIVKYTNVYIFSRIRSEPLKTSFHGMLGLMCHTKKESKNKKAYFLYQII